MYLATYYCPATHMMFRVNSGFLPNLQLSDTPLVLMKRKEGSTADYPYVLSYKHPVFGMKEDEDYLPELDATWNKVKELIAKGKIAIDEDVTEQGYITRN